MGWEEGEGTGRQEAAPGNGGGVGRALSALWSGVGRGGGGVGHVRLSVRPPASWLGISPSTPS